MNTPHYDTIDEALLQSLIDDKAHEDRNIEYKRQLPGKSDRDKHEYLCDLSSLANAGGGLLIWGVEEGKSKETGDTVASAIPGLPSENMDQAILRLEQLAQKWIEPRIPGLRAKVVPIKGSAPALVQFVPRSWLTPHMVSHNDGTWFFSRNSRGKCRMDVQQIGQMFLDQSDRHERIRRFVSERLGKILANEAAVPLEEGPTLVAHMVPLNHDPHAALVSHTDILKITGQKEFGWGRFPARFNLEGLVSRGGPNATGPAESYTQVFQSGAIESVSMEAIGRKERNGRRDSLHHQDLTQNLVDLGVFFQTFSRAAELSPPVAVFLNILNAKQVDLSDPSGAGFCAGHSFDRDTLVLPEQLVTTFEVPPAELFYSPFAAVFHAAGYHKVPYFDSSGKWVTN